MNAAVEKLSLQRNDLPDHVAVIGENKDDNYTLDDLKKMLNQVEKESPPTNSKQKEFNQKLFEETFKRHKKLLMEAMNMGSIESEGDDSDYQTDAAANFKKLMQGLKDKVTNLSSDDMKRPDESWDEWSFRPNIQKLWDPDKYFKNFAHFKDYFAKRKHAIEDLYKNIMGHDGFKKLMKAKYVSCSISELDSFNKKSAYVRTLFLIVDDNTGRSIQYQIFYDPDESIQKFVVSPSVEGRDLKFDIDGIKTAVNYLYDVIMEWIKENNPRYKKSGIDANPPNDKYELMQYSGTDTWTINDMDTDKSVKTFKAGSEEEAEEIFGQFLKLKDIPPD